MIFPWQKEQWDQLWRAKTANRLPHALLLTGMRDLGKAKFANDFAHALLCEHIDSNGMYCEKCQTCRLIDGRAHPNVLFIEPEKEGQAIKVDQIRQVSEFVNQSALRGTYRIVIINPANNMNVNAANALLKTLEEPSSFVVIILISDQSERLPATILSRCQRIQFNRPQKSLALEWLSHQLKDNTMDTELLLTINHGDPLAVLRFIDEKVGEVRDNLYKMLCQKQPMDLLNSAAKLQDFDSLCLIDFLLSWVLDILRLQLNVTEGDLTNKDFEKELIELSQQKPIVFYINFADCLQKLRGQISSGLNLNKQLMWESVLVKWVDSSLV